LIAGDVTIEGFCMIDSGTSYITVPQSMFYGFMNAVLPDGALFDCQVDQRSGSYLCPCEVSNRARPIGVYLNGRLLEVQPADFFEGYGDGSCVVQVMPTDQALPTILGDTFLRTVVASFDYQSRSITIAQLRGKEEGELALRGVSAFPSQSPREALAPFSALLAAAALTLGVALWAIPRAICRRERTKSTTNSADALPYAQLSDGSGLQG